MNEFKFKSVQETEEIVLDGITAGTVTAGKAIVAGTNKNVDVLAIADLKLGAGAGTSVTKTAAEINALPIVEQVAIADIALADGVAAVGANPTKAEYDVVVALANANKAKINDILAKLRLANIIAE